MVHILQLPLRGLQIAFCAIVLGLSASLSKGQIFGNAPAITNLNAFNGALGLLVAFIGIAAAFVESIPFFVMAALDGLAIIFYIAGSVAYAVKLGVHSCTSNGDGNNIAESANRYTQSNSIINAGTYDKDGRPYVRGTVNFESRCRMAQADDAFLFFALACFIASLGMDFFGARGRGGGRSRV
ncbi:MAG: hypothetical protein M1828_003419 [Chrysothrix sp. TS-e1954]|nr:MAG: hypothetical protein M1828_003419 [Chrysothrix sp. TS-e1954]